jgi:hypothetical protein
VSKASKGIIIVGIILAVAMASAYVIISNPVLNPFLTTVSIKDLSENRGYWLNKSVIIKAHMFFNGEFLPPSYPLYAYGLVQTENDSQGKPAQYKLYVYEPPLSSYQETYLQDRWGKGMTGGDDTIYVQGYLMFFRTPAHSGYAFYLTNFLS